MPIPHLLPNPENCSQAELETAIKAAASSRSCRRFMAINMLLLGQEPALVATVCLISHRTLLRWINYFNQSGIDGLLDSPRSGRPRKIKPEQSCHYTELIKHPKRVNVTHWTAKKFHGHLREKLNHEVGYRTVVRWLHEQNFRLKVPQPWPDRQNDEHRKAFVERLKQLLADTQIDLWFGDEMGVEGDPRPRRRWAQKGEKTRVTKNGDHVRMNVTGAICPRTGVFYAWEFTHSDRDSFQVFLDNANDDIAFERPRNIFICDNASWHKVKSLDWGCFEPMYLPAYSPDLNPIERLWLLIKEEWFSDFIAKDRDHLVARLDQALCWAINRQSDNRQTCSIKTKL